MTISISGISKLVSEYEVSYPIRELSLQHTVATNLQRRSFHPIAEIIAGYHNDLSQEDVADISRVFELCAEAGTACFSSIKNFQDYAASGATQIVVGEGEEFRVERAYCLYRDVFTTVVPKIRGEIPLYEVPAHILDKMLIPLGLKTAVDYFKGTTFTLRYYQDFSLSANRTFTLVLEKPKQFLATSITDLFQVMAISSTRQITPSQFPLVITDLVEFEAKASDLNSLFHRAFSPRVPPGYRWRVNGSPDATMSHVELPCGKTPEKVPSVMIENPHALTLHLLETYEFDSLSAFCEHMRVHGKITIPSGKILKITDLQISGIANGYPQEGQLYYPNPFHYLMDRLVQSLGNRLRIEGGYTWERKENTIGLTAKQGCTLILKPCTRLPIHLQTLGPRLIQERLFQIRGPSFIIASPFTADEERAAIEAMAQNSTIQSAQAMARIIRSRNPSKTLEWKFEKNCAFGSLIKDNRLFGIEVFSPDGDEAVIKLVPSHSGTFLIKLIDKCKGLAEGLKESDKTALLALMFQTLMYVCFEGYIEQYGAKKHLLPLFKQAAAIEATFESADFQKILNEIKASELLKQEFISLIWGSLDNFPPDQKTLSPELRIVFKHLMDFAYSEVKASSSPIRHFVSTELVPYAEAEAPFTYTYTR